MRECIQRGCREAHPKLVDIRRDFEVIKQITRTSTQVINCQKFFRVIQGMGEKAMWASLHKIKYAMGDPVQIILHDARGISRDLLRKMVEFVFQVMQWKVSIYN